MVVRNVESLGDLVALSAKDLVEVRDLLTVNDLDSSDISDELMSHFMGVKHHDQLVAVGGLEIFREEALLRSVATRSEFRGMNLAQRVIRALEKHALEAGASSLYLLTTTADRYFEQLGYRRRDRSRAPESIASTSQFSDLCPESATMMCKALPVSDAN